MRTPWIYPALTLCVGAVGGYLTGNNTSTSETAAAADTRDDKARGRSSITNNGKSPTRRFAKTAIKNLSSNSARIQALMNYYSGLTSTQLRDEARKLEQLPLTEQTGEAALLFGQWAEIDPVAALAYSRTVWPVDGSLLPIILKSWASVDPAAAAAYFEEHPREFAMTGNSMRPQEGAAIVAREWAGLDPEAAMAWAGSFGSGRAETQCAVLGEVARIDPTKATRMLADISGNTSAACRIVAERYGTKDLENARAWIRTLPLEEQQAALVAAMAGLAKHDPKTAAREIWMMEEGAAKDTSIAITVQQLARTNLQEAADFLNNGGEQAREQAAGNLVRIWLAEDPAGALNYVDSMPAGAAKDQALRAYVTANINSSPAELLTVAESIGQEDERRDVIGGTIERWMREDQRAALDFLKRTDSIPEFDKPAILLRLGIPEPGAGE